MQPRAFESAVRSTPNLWNRTLAARDPPFAGAIPVEARIRSRPRCPKKSLVEGSYHLGRQPVVDVRGRVVGYELLYRSSASASVAFIEDTDAASLRVIGNAFARFGLHGVLGPHLGFINVTRDMLLSELVLALPAKRVHFEILETVEFDRELVARCKWLRERGYGLALDDYVPGDPREPYVELVDVVKVDLPAIPKGELRGLVRGLRERGATVLAEKVETAEEHALCRELGCTLFQGYHFAKPTTLTSRSGAEDRAGLVRVLALIERADTAALAEAVEAHPALSVRLLRIVNSAYEGTAERIASIRDVVVRLGRLALRRWVSILLLSAVESDPASPSFQNALRSARLLELLATRLRQPVEAGSAFLAGILRALAAVTGEPLDELVRDLDLEPAILEGLVEGRGTIGSLLRLTTELEGSGVPHALGELRSLGISPDELSEDELRAYEWVHEVVHGLGEQ